MRTSAQYLRLRSGFLIARHPGLLPAILISGLVLLSCGEKKQSESEYVDAFTKVLDEFDKLDRELYPLWQRQVEDVLTFKVKPEDAFLGTSKTDEVPNKVLDLSKINQRLKAMSPPQRLELAHVRIVASTGLISDAYLAALGVKSSEEWFDKVFSQMRGGRNELQEARELLGPSDSR